MDNLKNVSEISDCYGCGVCAIACPVKIIEIHLDLNGFYAPVIKDQSKCLKCGLCIAVCSYCHDELSVSNPVENSYAAWSKDADIRYRCSSGGVGYEVARTLLKDGYKVCGVRYNLEKNRAEHYVSANDLELEQTIGSKYIQSYTVDGFRAIDKSEKYLVTGTPCQIDSFRRYLLRFKAEDNFVLMDFFCHGVPSMFMWRKYLHYVDNKIGLGTEGTKFTEVSWRNKFNGWHDSYAMHFVGDNCEYSSRFSEGDSFYLMFLSNSCLGKACYDKCKFKYDNSSADIRIGDLWGKAYSSNQDGVSAAVAFTAKGNKILTGCNCELQKLPFDVVAEGQMKEAPGKNILYDKIHSMLLNDVLLISKCTKLIEQQQKLDRILFKIKHPIKTYRSIFNRIVKNKK